VDKQTQTDEQKREQAQAIMASMRNHSQQVWLTAMQAQMIMDVFTSQPAIMRTKDGRELLDTMDDILRKYNEEKDTPQ